MATLAAVTNLPALALLGEDGRLERSTEPFRRWYADNAHRAECAVWHVNCRDIASVRPPLMCGVRWDRRLAGSDRRDAGPTARF